MKLIRTVFGLASMALAACAFADGGNTLLAFQTVRDTYADGATVADGEWYALCWSADGKFDGLKLDCTPVDANDELVLTAPLAKDGCCPYTIFQIDSKVAKTSGEYVIYLLDTRDANGTPAKAGKNGLPAGVNGAVAAKDYTAAAATAGAKEKGVVAGAEWSESVVDESVDGYKVPVIKSFDPVADGKVKILVVDLMPNVRYNVQMGSDLENMNSYGLTTPKGGVEQANFELDAGDAKFFKVTREPLKK